MNYFQSVLPELALGGEMFWLGKQRKSGMGFAARHTGEKHIATCQIATTGLASLTYLHRLTDKVRAAPRMLSSMCALTHLRRQGLSRSEEGSIDLSA